MKGKVKWFNGVKGFGFIEKEDGSGDVFMYHSVIKKEDRKKLKEGDAVEFEAADSDKGQKATSVAKAQ